MDFQFLTRCSAVRQLARTLLRLAETDSWAVIQFYKKEGTVGSEMVLYGMVKIVPLQMPFPFLTRLEPYGNFSPMGVLWYPIGASPGYEKFVGSAEKPF